MGGSKFLLQRLSHWHVTHQDRLACTQCSVVNMHICPPPPPPMVSWMIRLQNIYGFRYPFVMFTEMNVNASYKFGFHYFNLFTSWKMQTGRTGSENLVEGILVQNRHTRRCYTQSEPCLMYLTPSLQSHLLISPVHWAGLLLRMKLTC